MGLCFSMIFFAFFPKMSMFCENDLKKRIAFCGIITRTVFVVIKSNDVLTWNEYKILLHGIYLSKALTCMNFFLYKRNMIFIKETDTDTFGRIVVWTIYTSHIDHFTPQHTAFEQSAACSLVFVESLPGLIPFAILWHAGWNLEKKNIAWTWTKMIRLQYLELIYPKCTHVW